MGHRTAPDIERVLAYAAGSERVLELHGTIHQARCPHRFMVGSYEGDLSRSSSGRPVTYANV